MQILKDIIDVFQRFRMPPTKIDEWEQGGREAFSSQLDTFVGRNKAIEFRMLGFPFKSTNRRDKTIGRLPDMAEQVSLKHLARFTDEIRSIYAPGATVTIVSDGYIFNDILEEPDDSVHEYWQMSSHWAKETPVTIMTLKDFYPSACLREGRTRLMTDFGITDSELERRILLDADVNSLYRGMIKFMEQELACKTFPSNRQLHLAAKRLAREMMFRNEAMTRIAATELPRTIRLSMHPSTNKTKYGFQMIPGPRSWASPWHCALLVERDGTYSTIHKKDAEAAGYELVSVDGRPFNYQQH